jgi:pyrroline-5-carboxylate reductase
LTITTFIGGGNMATALAGGMLARGQQPDGIRIVELLAERREVLARRFSEVGVHAQCDATALAGADLVVFAVKPQQMRDAARALAPHLERAPETLVLSIAAGIRIADLARWLDGHRRLVRAMPNTPALVGKGISGVFAAREVDARARARCASVLEAGGEIVWLATESMLDAVTGVSGSGPAYVFYFLEALERSARELGFSAADARRLAYATFDGAIALAKASADEPATLRAQVTSKGGTTERALTVMEDAGVRDAIMAAVGAAAQRARELGDDFGKDG